MLQPAERVELFRRGFGHAAGGFPATREECDDYMRGFRAGWEAFQVALRAFLEAEGLTL